MRILSKVTTWVEKSVPVFCEDDVRRMIAEGRNIDEINDFIGMKCDEANVDAPIDEFGFSVSHIAPEDNGGEATIKIDMG